MQHFTDYLQSRDLSPMTIKMYTREINLFISWYGTEDIINVQKKDILNYLNYLKNQKNYQTVTSNHGLIALRHYFDGLKRQDLIQINPTSLIKLRGLKKRRLQYIYNPEELTQLADDFYQLYVKTAQEKITSGARHNTVLKSYYAQMRNYVMFHFLIYQGLTTTEVLNLQLQNIDLHKATITIQTTTRGNDRTLPLHATQTGALMQYLNEVRPQLAYAESEKVFLPVPQKHATEKPDRILFYLSSKIKRIDRNYKTLAQIRASLITYWIQTYGLRKAQYLAGHKSINSTEEYVPNNIEDLAEDITKFNPF